MKNKAFLNQKKISDSVMIAELISLAGYTTIAREASVFQANLNDLEIHIKKENLISDELKNSPTMIDSIIGQEVVFYLPQMNLDLKGIVTHTAPLGEKTFKVLVSLAHHTPDDWKKCLLDLFSKT